MALLVAQLLFVDRIDDRTVHLDLVVLDRAETSVSPPVGAPLGFAFRLTGPPEERDALAATLEGWAERSATIHVALLERRGATKVRLRAGSGSVTLEPVGTADRHG